MLVLAVRFGIIRFDWRMTHHAGNLRSLAGDRTAQPSDPEYGFLLGTDRPGNGAQDRASHYSSAFESHRKMRRAAGGLDSLVRGARSGGHGFAVWAGAF